MDQLPDSQENLTGTIFKNATFVTIGTILLKVFNFIFTVYVVRRLGDDRMGQYGTALAFVGIFQIFAELGITQFIMREIARDKSKIRTYFWNLVVLRIILASINLVIIPIAALAFGYSPEIQLGILIYTASFLLSSFSVPLTMVITANERLGYVSAIDVAAQVTFLIFGSIFLFSGLGYIWLIVASLISIFARAIIATGSIRHLHITGFSFHLEPGIWWKLIRSGLPFGIISLMLSIAFSVDTVMLSKFVSEAEVGWYGVAYKLVFSLMLFMGGFTQAMVPSLSRVFVSDIDKVKRWYHTSVKFIMLISIPIAIGGFLLAFPIVQFLYTDEFIPSGFGLKILIWDVPLLMFAAFCGDMTTITNEERAAARIYTVNTVANVVLNFLLIPRYGMIGASFVTVITDLISALQFYFLLRRKLDLPDMSWVLARIIIAGILMGAIVWLLSSYNFILVTAVGGIVYILLILVFRLVSTSEWSLIARFVKFIRKPKEVI